MAAFLFELEWDPAKAWTNFRKHGVDFERTAEVFHDPLALTIPDDEHSIAGLRSVRKGQSILVVHKFEQLDDETARIRIISARRPTRTESRGYEEQQ